MMPRSFDAIKRKFLSPLANKQANLVRQCDETEVKKRHSSQIDVLVGTATATSGVNDSWKPPSPRSVSQLGKRANSCNLLVKPKRKTKLQRRTYLKDPKLSVRCDALQPSDDDYEHRETLPSSNEQLMLDTPLLGALQEIESSELSSASRYETTLVATLAGTVREVHQQSDEGIRLTARKDSLQKLQGQLAPTTCHVSHQYMPGVSKETASAILRLLQDPKSTDGPNRESTKEEYLSAELSTVVSSELPSREKPQVARLFHQSKTHINRFMRSRPGNSTISGVQRICRRLKWQLV